MRYTIPRKTSGTGTIHDISSEHCDRMIIGRGHYAVVLATYYGSNPGYTTHLTQRAAARASQRVRALSHQIIDEQGREYISYPESAALTLR